MWLNFWRRILCGNWNNWNNSNEILECTEIIINFAPNCLGQCTINRGTIKCTNTYRYTMQIYHGWRGKIKVHLQQQKQFNFLKCERRNNVLYSAGSARV